MFNNQHPPPTKHKHTWLRVKQENKFFFNKTDLYKKKEKEEERITKRERERGGWGKKVTQYLQNTKEWKKRKKENNSNLNLRDWFNML